MRVLIVSDTHRVDKNLKKVIELEQPIDMFIHLGDIEGSEISIGNMLSVRTALHMVRGNNDFFSSLPKEKEIMLDGYRALITHGHYYGVTLGVEHLVDEAKSRYVDIAMYGHTHRPFYENVNGVIVLNPGSLSYPRQEGHKPSYMIMNIDESGKIEVDIRYVEPIVKALF